MTMDEGEQLKRIVVEPMIDGLRKEMQPIIKLLNAHDTRLDKLESTNKKAMVGWATIATVGTVGWNWLQAKVRGSK